MNLLSTTSSSSASTQQQLEHTRHTNNNNNTNNNVGGTKPALVRSITDSFLHIPSPNPPQPPPHQQQQQQQQRPSPLILQAPQPSDILFFKENPFDLSPQSTNLMMLSNSNGVNQQTNATAALPISPMPRPIVKKSVSSANMSVTSSGVVVGGSTSSGKRVRFPDDTNLKEFSDAPKRGWHPGKHSTSDLLDAYIRACDKNKCKPLGKLMQQLKALQDLDCANGEKVNVLNMKSNKILLLSYLHLYLKKNVIIM